MKNKLHGGISEIVMIPIESFDSFDVSFNSGWNVEVVFENNSVQHIVTEDAEFEIVKPKQIKNKP